MSETFVMFRNGYGFICLLDERISKMLRDREDVVCTFHYKLWSDPKIIIFLSSNREIKLNLKTIPISKFPVDGVPVVRVAEGVRIEKIVFQLEDSLL